MNRRRTQSIALVLYRDVIADAGHASPYTYLDLLEIVLASGAMVVSCQNAPPGFTGVQIGDVVYVNGSPRMSDHQRVRVLAHEWCHWLRRLSRNQYRHVRLYQGTDATEGRDQEEQIARSFERLF